MELVHIIKQSQDLYNLFNLVLQLVTLNAEVWIVGKFDQIINYIYIWKLVMRCSRMLNTETLLMMLKYTVSEHWKAARVVF